MKTPEPKQPESKPEKVLIVNEFGAEATPYKTDLQPWLDQGWKIKDVSADQPKE